LDALEGRQLAAKLIVERPHASLREVARLAGISPATVSDVRKRLESGQPPAGIQPDQPPGEGDDHRREQAPRSRTDRRMRLVHSDPALVLAKLVRDPSLRDREEGRQLLRLLQQNAMGTRQWSDLTAAVPAHCSALVVDLARQCAEIWLDFAQELDQRTRAADEIAATG
jgi:hypothetical protein